MTRVHKDLRQEVLTDLQSIGRPVGINTLVVRLERGRSAILTALRELMKAKLVTMDPGVRKWKGVAPEKTYQAVSDGTLATVESDTKVSHTDPKGLPAILAALEEPSTPEQVAQVAKVSVRHARNVLNALFDEGKVTRRPGQRSEKGGNVPQVYEKRKES